MVFTMVRDQYYVEELVRRRFLIIPVKSYGTTLKEAKAPIIPRNFQYKLTYRPMMITKKTIDLIRAGKITAFGIPGINNKLIWLDIEADVVNSLGENRILNLFKGTYIERSPRGGLHIAFIKDVSTSGPKGVSDLVDNKTYGYVVSYPSVLFAEGREWSYDKISREEIWRAKPYSKFIPYVKEFYSMLSETYQEHFVLEDGEIPPMYGVGTKIRSLLHSWTADEMLLLLLAVSEKIGCSQCLEEHIVNLIKRRPLKIPNRMYPTKIERGIHCVSEVELLGALFLLGASARQLEEIASRITYEGQEGFDSPPELNVKYNIHPEREPISEDKDRLQAVYSSKGLSIAYKSACPFGLIKNLTCLSKLTLKVSMFIKNDLPTLIDLIDAVMEVRRRK